MTAGVPQGTILGPVMFLVYINDICKDINSFCKLYADDCVLYRPIRSYQDKLFLQNELNTIFKWSKKWNFNFNIDKCKVMYLSERRIKEKFIYCIGNSFLAETCMEKYLGINVTDILWKEHVSSVKKDCYSRLGVIKRVFGKCSKSVNSPGAIVHDM